MAGGRCGRGNSGVSSRLENRRAFEPAASSATVSVMQRHGRASIDDFGHQVQAGRHLRRHCAGTCRAGPVSVTSSARSRCTWSGERVGQSVDSELGNDIYITNVKRVRAGQKPIIVDHEIDSRLLVKMVTEAKKVGIFSIGGGVPRNNIQNVAPLIEIMNIRLNLNLPQKMFSYACRIDPTLPYLGNLSGCTYSEGGSWRKMDIKHGRFSEVLADATMILPFYAAGLNEVINK